MNVPQFTELIDTEVTSGLAITNTVVINKCKISFYMSAEYIYEIKS